MPPHDEHNSIEELKKSLYERATPDVRTRRKLRFGSIKSDVATGWGESEIEKPHTFEQDYTDHSMSFLTKILIGSGIFCVIAVSIGLYVFFNGSNLISPNNIDVTVSGPVSIPGGAPVSFNIRVTNKNNIDLQLVDMKVDFPAGVTNPQDPTETLTTYTQLLGDIPMGVSTSTKVGAIIFGEENTQKQITATFTYKVRGSSAVFTKIATYDVLINSSPITASIDSFSSITSGQEFDLTLRVKSNSTDVLKNIIAKAQYPFGFTYISSNIPPLADNMTWKIGDMPPGSERVITIHGKIQGEDTDTRIFHFSVGARSTSNSAVIGTQYALISQDITIEKAFMTVGIQVDSDSSNKDIVGRFGSSEHVVVSWYNNLPVSVANAVIVVNLGGTAYDKLKIQPDLGYFDSVNNRIIWNQQTNPELGSISAGANGTVSFTIIPTNTGSSSRVNPSINLTANVTADRTQEFGVSGSLSATANRTIRIASNAALSGRIVRSTGPFINTGPIPPKAEQSTTYTVMWTVSNTTSSVSNAEVTATLPAYVSWVGATYPASENITYDTNTGTVTWHVGSIAANTLASGSQRREAAFQISFKPSVTQITMSPTLLNQATLTAVDDFTQTTLTNTQDYLTTSYSTDPAYKGGHATVVE